MEIYLEVRYVFFFYNVHFCPCCIFCPDISFSLLLLVFAVCGLALLGVISVATWKLCWVPWRSKVLSFSTTALAPTRPERDQHREEGHSDYYPALGDIMAADKLKDPGNFLEAAVKISHTSPDIPADVQLSMKDHLLRRTRISRQTTEPTSSNRSVFWKNEEMFVSEDLYIGHHDLLYIQSRYEVSSSHS